MQPNKAAAVSRSSGDFCPLCDAASFHDELPVSTAEIRHYWAGMDYDIDSDFPLLPDHLLQRRCASCGLHWFVPALIGPPGLYEQLLKWPPYDRREAWEWRETIGILRQAGMDEVLEVGAGTGVFLEQAQQWFAKCEGIEFNTAAVETAQRRGLAVSNCPLSEVSGGRSAIVAHQVLEHLEAPDDFFRTCAEKLRPGGLLVVAVPNQDGFIGALKRDFLNRPPHHATLWRESCFRMAAYRFGLELVDYRSAPLALYQFKIYLLRNTQPSPTVSGKLMNLVRRAAVALFAPVLFPFVHKKLPGEAHLAVFQKPKT